MSSVRMSVCSRGIIYSRPTIYWSVGIRYIQKLAKTRAFRQHGTKSTQRVHPLCSSHDEDSDEYWLCYIKETISTIYHPVGTCKMGPIGDSRTVVDPTLK